MFGTLGVARSALHRQDDLVDIGKLAAALL
jgi:hypothetical protein